MSKSAPPKGTSSGSRGATNGRADIFPFKRNEEEEGGSIGSQRRFGRNSFLFHASVFATSPRTRAAQCPLTGYAYF